MPINPSFEYTIPVAIRPAVKEDVNFITALIFDLAREESFIGIDPQQTSSTRTKEILNNLLECQNSLLLLATVNNNIAGMAFATPPDPEDSGKIAVGLCVLQDYRAMGIGSRLMQKIIHWCEDTKRRCLVLSVIRHNTKALRLYKRLGFSAVEDKTMAFGTGLSPHVIIMQKHVTK